MYSMTDFSIKVFRQNYKITLKFVVRSSLMKLHTHTIRTHTHTHSQNGKQTKCYQMISSLFLVGYFSSSSNELIKMTCFNINTQYDGKCCRSDRLVQFFSLKRDIFSEFIGHHNLGARHTHTHNSSTHSILFRFDKIIHKKITLTIRSGQK